MSIQSEINRLNTNVANALAAISEKGVSVPSGSGSDELAELIRQISASTTVFAIINATYPAGATVTCSKGTTTLTAPDTSGSWMIVVPEAGTWTVTATQGSNTKSQSVSITTQGQVATVTLSFRYYLFNNGKVNNINWAGSAGQYSSYSIGSTLKVTRYNYINEWAMTWATSAINLTSYSKLCVNVTARSGSKLSLSVATKQEAELEDVVATKSITSTGITELSISSINTSRYVYVHADYLETSATAGSMTVSQVWLE